MSKRQAKEEAVSEESGPRIGVFVCDCGGEISGVLDTRILRDAAEELPGVVYAASEAYPCSRDGRARIQRAIVEHGLERVLVAGCTPRLVEKLFLDAIKEAGLDRAWLDMRDIREQCAYVHADDPQAATQKASDLIAMGVERLGSASPGHAYEGPVVKRALVIGSELGGLTVAATLAARGIEVVVADEAGELGGPRSLLLERGQALVAEAVKGVQESAAIEVRLNARVARVLGQPGQYEVTLDHGGEMELHSVGAIVLACGAEIKGLNGDKWHDRQKVKSLGEYGDMLEAASASGDVFPSGDIVIVLDAEGDLEARSLRLNSAAVVQQALRTKQLFPRANVTVLFRDLPLGNESLEAFTAAKTLGVTFFRCQEGCPAVLGEKTVDVHDAITGDTLRIPYDVAALAMPVVPMTNADSLAAMLRLPQDEHGFIVEPRIRLRPGSFVDDGIYVLGSAHHPSEASETLFHAYLASSRVQRFLEQDSVRIESATAGIDEALCTGCGTCVQACPRLAIEMRKHEGVLSKANVDSLRCIGCGNCVVVCPVRAIALPGWGDAALFSQISAATRRSTPEFSRDGAPLVLALACEWSAYAAADMAGVQRISYPSGVRIIPMNCSARFDPNLVLWAFLNGAQGVVLGACHSGECHYGTGNLHAVERVEILKKNLAEQGIDSRRLRLEFLAGDDGKRFAQVVTEFVSEIEDLDG